MLGRRVAARLDRDAPHSLVSPALVEVAREADLFVLNLECCISDRGDPWPSATKPYFFRAPPAAVDLLTLLGVDCVTLANNHALDFGAEALLDTIGRLGSAGIRTVGAGADVREARRSAVLEHAGLRLSVIGVTDHRPFAAGRRTPGVAYADLGAGLDRWLADAVRDGAGATDAVLVTPHWGPNATTEPRPSLRRAARDLLGAGATLIAGHSAHVFHGVEGRVLYDLGDFLDDYRVHLQLRNDLGLFWFVDLEAGRPRRLEAVPIDLQFCRTDLARGSKARWIRDRFTAACAAFGTDVRQEGDRLVVEW
jgi:poly-gamma-glutamate synthesis protein (capsule biosynthesis protein)